MDLQRNKIPNKMLRGGELLEIAVQKFREQLQNDCYFNDNIAYPRVAFTIQATFHLGYPLPDPHIVKVRTPVTDVIEGEAPFKDPQEDDELLSLERDIIIDNPNVARISNGLPIVVQERQAPTPLQSQNAALMGEEQQPNPFPSVVNHELKYDPTQFPAGPAPVDRNVSDKKAAELGVKRKGK